MTFGERLRKRRMELGLRQEDVGKWVHVGKSTVSQWENGIHMPDMETVSILANHLGVSVDWLLGRTNDPHPAPEESVLPDIRRIARAAEKMTPEQRKKWIETSIQIAKVLFPEAFEKDGKDT
ncbi:helix-turn-helix domain-containing protein [Desulfovirgula thermocuniculi]|uniref:helix-turn-helix domain-containing protein n=1 Tax=Desulfovirgula thermocuniculi TaxID=348842 RepID=UPI00248119D0|nr:helix-turn-helix transcriptional regulator [Desulfovirgula thermocuniculi]